MSGKILSVIVPSYNMEKYLPKCLGSVVVAPALMEKLEVLVVNDGSKDRTSEIAHGFEAQYPGTFRVIDKANGNYGSCINRGLAEATGFYVKVLDADDFVDTAAFSDYLEALVEEAAKGDGAADLVVTDYVVVDEAGKVTERPNFGLKESAASFGGRRRGDPRFTVHAVTYRTENVRRIGYRQTEGISYTDTEWVIEPMVTVRRLKYLPRVVTHYLLGRAGQTMETKTFASHFGQFVDIVRGLVARISERMSQLEPEAREYFREQVLVTISHVYACCTVESYRKRITVDLAVFDDFLAGYPELYRESEDLFIPSNKFPLRHVREWRRRRSANTLRFALFRAYKGLMSAVAKIRLFCMCPSQMLARVIRGCK